MIGFVFNSAPERDLARFRGLLDRRKTSSVLQLRQSGSTLVDASM